MANTLLTPSIIAEEALMQLENNCVMGNIVYRGYEREWMERSNGWKKGSSITAKTPVYFRVKDGETIDVVDLREEDITLSLDYRKHVAYKLTGNEMTYTIDRFSERFIQPAMQALGNFVDLTLLGLYATCPNQVGTPGTTPSTWYTIAQAGAVLTDEAVPKQNRHVVLDPWASAKIQDQLKGVFIKEKAKTIVESANFGRQIAGFEAWESQNVNTHTCGSAAGSTSVYISSAASEGDTTLTIDDGAAGAPGILAAGDITTVATVYGVNPISGQSTGRLRQFVCVTANAGSSADETPTVIPGQAPWGMYSASATEKVLPYQTVDALPANNDQLTVAGSSGLEHKVNLAFHEHAMCLFMVPVEAPNGLQVERKSYKGFQITVAIGGDIINYVNYIRFDVLFGCKLTNPFMACRIAG